MADEIEHRDATQVHKGSFVEATDPATTHPESVAADKEWIDKSVGPPYHHKVRNTANDDWEDVGSAVSAATTTTAGIVELATDGEVAANLVPQANDSRLSNARTPAAHTHASHTSIGADDHHAKSHAHDGADGSGTVSHASLSNLTAGDPHTQYHTDGRGDTRYTQRANNLSDVADAATSRTNLQLGTAATRDVPAGGDATADQAVKGDDTRLTDNRTPISHNHVAANTTDFSEASDDRVNAMLQVGFTMFKVYDDVANTLTLEVVDATTTDKGAVELATNGESAAGLVVQSNDSRLSDARTPTAHAATHSSGGSDPVSHNNLASIGTDDHHDIAHTHDGADGSGAVSYTSICKWGLL